MNEAEKFTFEQGVVVGTAIARWLVSCGLPTPRKGETLSESVQRELAETYARRPAPGFPDGIPREAFIAADPVLLQMFVERFPS